MSIKKFMALMLTLIICIMPTMGFAFEEANGVILNGQPIYADVKPVINNWGRTMIPARSLLEALGMKVSWNEAESTVIGEKEGERIVIFIGEYWNSTLTYNDVSVFVGESNAPIIVNSRTLLPVRLVSEVLGLKVSWDSYNKNVLLTEVGQNPEISLEKARDLLVSIPNETTFERKFAYNPLSSYASSDDFVKENYYIFNVYHNFLVWDNALNNYSSKSGYVWSYNLCVDKKTGEIKKYGPEGFFN